MSGTSAALGPSLPTKVMRSYALGLVLNDVTSAFWYSYLLLHMDEDLELDKFISGVVFAVGQFSNVLGSSLVRDLSDRHVGFLMLGKRKSWHILGAALVSFSILATFTPPLFGSRAVGKNIIYFSVCAFVFNFGWAASQISHSALATELADHPHEQSNLRFHCFLVTALCNVLVYTLVSVVRVQRVTGVLFPSSQAFSSMTVVLVVLVFFGDFCNVIFAIGTLERYFFEVPESATTPSQSEGGSRVPKCSCTVLPLVVVACGLCKVATNLTQIYLPVLVVTLKAPCCYLGIIPLEAFMGGWLTVWMVRGVAGRISLLGITFVSCVSVVAAVIMIELMISYRLSIAFLHISAVVLGGGTRAMALISSAIKDPLSTNVSFFEKASCGFAVLALQFVNRQQDDMRVFMRLLFHVIGASCVCATFFILCFWLTAAWERRHANPTRLVIHQIMA